MPLFRLPEKLVLIIVELTRCYNPSLIVEKNQLHSKADRMKLYKLTLIFKIIV